MLSYARTVTLSPEQHRSIEGLVAQVNVDNVLQVGALLRKQADDLKAGLVRAGQDLVVQRCGDDPVSRDAQQLFQAKVEQILAVHWAHWREIMAACDALRSSAHGYGHTEAAVVASFGPGRAVQ